MRHAEIIQGDALAVLRAMPTRSVHMSCTSPPYWGLRDYGIAGQLGLERTPAEYIDRMVEVFEEVRRVLRDDGTLWVNMGDCYHSGDRGGWRGDAHRWENSRLQSARRDRGGSGFSGSPNRLPQDGLKSKDLVGMPWRLAFALQGAGWYLRRDIIWHKPSCMPESVRDRPTTAHEYIFLLSKAKGYFYDAEAVRESDQGRDHRRMALEPPRRSGPGGQPDKGIRTPEGRNGLGRNLRSVWTIPSSPYPEAHFATFSPEIPRRCIAAGTSERGCCGACFAPWVREVLRPGGSWHDHAADLVAGKSQGGARRKRQYNENLSKPRGTIGWRPSCRCLSKRIAESGLVFPMEIEAANAIALADQYAEKWSDLAPAPCVVLDPFAGAGTTAMVALRMGRRAIGIELKPEYCEIAARRIERDAPLLNHVALSSFAQPRAISGGAALAAGPP